MPYLSDAVAPTNDLSRGVLLLPIAATEQHGPHLPLGTDLMIVQHVADRAAYRLRDLPVFVAPVLPYGFSAHHLPFGATCSVSVGALARFLREICESWIQSGSKRIFVLNGHGGNVETMQAVVKELAISSGLTLGCGSYWAMAEEYLSATGGARPDRIPGHAGLYETSAMLALRPDLVSSIPGGADDGLGSDPQSFKIDGPTRRIGTSGRTDDPSGATASLGVVLLDAAIDGVADGIKRYWQECARIGG